MAGKLVGKVALVTGASSGIGEATALALAGEGAQLAIVARRADRLEELGKRVTAQGAQVMQIVADVDDEAAIGDAVRSVNEKWGHIDILINNAGVMLLGPIDGADTNDWRRMINTNLLGLMYTTHAVLPIMKAQGAGHIVNVSSVAGRVANPNAGVYAATKFGVVAFSESLRREVYSNNIRVTVIEPGMVATELAEHITNPEAKKATQERAKSMTPLTAEDIAAAITYAVTQGQHVNVNEILIRPTGQER